MTRAILPSPSEADEVVASVDVSLNSEMSTLGALSRAAQKRGRRHDVIVMVDLGDLREGLWPRDLSHFTGDALRLPGIRIAGLGTNLACFGGVVPSEDNMRRLGELADEVERNFGLKLDWISGANSSGLDLIAAGRMPARVNQARIGEAILLGREEIEIEGLTPHDARLKILGASSSYLVVDTSAAAGMLEVGDELSFAVKYGALLTAMTSEYVKKTPVREAFTTQLTSEAKIRYDHR